MNQDVKSRIEGYKYWDIFSDDVAVRSHQEVLADIDDLMTNVVEDVTERAKKEGKDPAQTRKMVAGKYFHALVSYATAETAGQNGLRLLHDRNLSSTDLAGAIPSIGDGGLALTPDADIIYYNPDDEATPIFILSCKTSFRERMAQSGMWKILFQISKHDCLDPNCPARNYSFSGDFDRDIYMGFATADFYGDVESKNIVEMFDFGYAPSVATNQPNQTVYSLPRLLDHIENKWSSFR